MQSGEKMAALSESVTTPGGGGGPSPTPTTQYLFSLTVNGVGTVSAVGTFMGEPRTLTETNAGMIAGYFDANTTVVLSVVEGTLQDCTLNGFDQGPTLPTITMTQATYVVATFAAAPPAGPSPPTVSACQQQYGDWSVLNPIRDFFCWLQGIATS
jgi:hypothetical protein